MYRVLVPAVLSLALAGCSMASYSLTAGFANSGQPAPRTRTPETGSIDRPATRAVAKADDKAPKGTFEKAPTGALSDRDYSGTRLDAERARDIVNTYRKTKGLRPLQLQPALTEAARAHSRDLAKWDRISHFGSDGSNPWDRVKRAGYPAKLAAENVGTGQASVEEVVKGWQASPGHNKNLLLPDAQHMGIALVQDTKTEFKTFWTLVIGSPL
ncbi:MAG: CAP domain-containing protein [Hyphomonadaceae bacterium]|nr:CAP domain-containing protein [Hyphomonadaceae bacterium]